MLSLRHLCQSSLHSLLPALTPAEQHRGLPGGCAHITCLPPDQSCDMVDVPSAGALWHCGTVSTCFCQSSQCLGFTHCTCTWVCSSGCLLCAWGGAVWHRRDGREVLGLQQWEEAGGAECPRHHAGEQKGIAIFFEVFHIWDVQVTRVAWALLCSASALQWVPGSCCGCRAPPYPC